MACRMTGKELAALRRRSGLSQSALARRTGLSRQAISYWEGKPALDGRAATLTKIASAFDQTDRQHILNSRPGLGFTALHFTAPTPEHWNLIHTAIAIRKATEAQLQRRPCGATTRKGAACKLASEPGKKRCRLHGGLSTGPKTAEGKARIAEAQRRRWADRRKAKGKPDNTE